MFFLWILGIVSCLIAIKYAFLLAKRIQLISKIKKHVDEIIFHRNRFRSVFFPDGKIDLTVKKEGKTYSIFILTTPFRRVRYHFINNEKLEIFMERRAVFVLNHRAPGNNASMDRVSRIKTYRISFSENTNEDQYVIPHPAPRSLSRVDGAHLNTLGNGDVFYGKIRICGLRFFLDQVLSGN